MLDWFLNQSCRTERLTIGVLELVAEPVQTLVQTVPAGGTGGLDVPVAVPERVQAKLVCDLCSIHGVGQVLRGSAHHKCCPALHNYPDDKRESIIQTGLDL